MKKIALIYLLVCFLMAPFAHAMGISCHGADGAELCSLNKDLADHNQEVPHHHNCHVSADFPKTYAFYFTLAEMPRFLPRYECDLPLFETNNGLYRPPIV